jgi:hypothetical protein
MSPTKLELFAAWLPTQPWFAGDATQLVNLGSYRLDDPAGEVGLEGVLLSAGDATVYHVPVTFRDAPLEVADGFSLGTSEHGVLGTRWVTSGVADPVFREQLAAVIAEGGRQADLMVQDAEGNMSTRDPLVLAQGTGRPGETVPNMEDASVEEVGSRSRIENGTAVLDIVRVVDETLQAADDQLALEATWREQPAPVVLALLYAG